LANELKTGK